MATNDTSPKFAYGIGNALVQLAPRPIVSNRAPTTSDLAEIGTNWIDKTNDDVYALTSISAAGANWATTPAGGATTLVSLDITGLGGLDVQNAGSTTTISSGTINFDNAAATTTVSGDLTVAGVFTMTGDFDLTSGALIDLTSTLNASPSIYLHANGGVNEQVLIHSDQGTAVDSVRILSDVGGLTLRAASNGTDNAINLEAPSGGLDIDVALQMNLDSAEATADAIRIVTSNAGGGIDVDSGTAGIALDSTGAISLDAAAASNFTVTGAGIDLTLDSAAGRVIVNGEEAAANAITLLSAAGGIDADAALQINIASSQAAGDAIRIDASDAAGGIDIDDGGGGMTLDSVAGISLDAAAASNFTVAGAGIDLTLDSGGGRVIVNGEEAAANAITLLSTAGGIDADAALQINIASSQAAIDAVRIDASDAGGGIDIDDGGGGTTIDSAAGISLDAAGASNFTVAGAGIDLTLDSGAGRVIINGEEAAANAITLLSAAGGIDADAALQINIASSQAAADAIRIDASDAAGGIDIDDGGGGTTIDSAAAVAITGAANSSIGTTGAGIDMTVSSAAGRVIVNGEEAAANAITLLSAAGGIDADAALQINIASSQAAGDAIRIDASDAAGGIDIDDGGGGTTIDSAAAISLDAAAASNFSVSGAGIDLDLASAAGSINIAGDEAAADAVVLSSAAGGIQVSSTLQMSLLSVQAAADAILLNASDAAGGIELTTGGGPVAINAGGDVSVEAATATDNTGPGATAAVTINERVGVATLQGFTTGAAASLVLTVTNSVVTAGSAILCSASNLGGNDAQILVSRILPGSGTFDVTLINNGAAALNGDVLVTFWVIV